MIGSRRGRAGDVATRLARAEELSAGDPAAAEPLRLMVAILRHHQSRAGDELIRSEAGLLAACADVDRVAGLFPLFDLEPAAQPILAELDVAVAALVAGGAVPEPLAAAGEELVGRPTPARRELVEAWLDDPSVLEPAPGFWIRVAAGPLLETAATAATVPTSEQWHGGACPLCGGQAQVSVIAEESEGLLGESPRLLVCGRCAAWWSFPRAVCAVCGEEDAGKLGTYVVEGERWVRIDACEPCHGYVKTFDLREAGGLGVVPLVDDVATLALDRSAAERGLSRPLLSFAGV